MGRGVGVINIGELVVNFGVILRNILCVKRNKPHHQLMGFVSASVTHTGAVYGIIIT